MSAIEQLNRTILLCRDYVSDALSDGSICQGFQSVRALCVADATNLSSHSGQSCLTTVVALLSRMGMQVTLRIPEISMIRRQSPFRGTLLRDSLLASSNNLISGATVQQDTSEREPDLIFVLGDSAIEERPCPTWRLRGSEWHGAMTQRSTLAPRWSGEWPIGAMTSAALAAGEALKFVMRRLPLRRKDDLVFFEPSPESNWDFGSITIPAGELDLGEVDIVSAGAISQAALYALLRLPQVRIAGRIFDDDTTSTTNFNRNMLTLVGDADSAKVRLVADRCSPEFGLTPKYQRFVAGAPESRQLAPYVLVGVDDIPSRWQVQRCTSGVLIVSGTSHFSISSSCHGPGQPCCGCQHPLDDRGGPTEIPIASFISFWAGLAMAVRLIRRAVGAGYGLDRQHLWLTPLRMDQPHAAVWSPVARRRDCPVQCLEVDELANS
ncbi:MAG TPA: hypothetical protein VJN93_01230 [Candidatus Acidoferrum sp.]|nr:hypothetical protein [Candidatus Acidoferrum sp.]